MTKFQKTFLLFFLLLLAALVYLESIKPQPISWFPSYAKEDRIPYGTFVLFDLLKENFKTDFEEINQPPFEVLKDSSFNGTYLFINNQVDFDETEVESLLAWAEAGNTVFVSANYHSENLLDTLKLEMASAFEFDQIQTEPLLNLINKKLTSPTPFHLKRNVDIRYFDEIDTLSQTVLGVTQVFNDTLKITEPLINFIKAPVGKGEIYLHAQPEIFSNFFLLSEENAVHSQNVLSYLNNGGKIHWDDYYKTGKHINISPLRVLLGNKFLKWAYYFVLFGAFLFIIFEGKRKQRSIPVVVPLTNKSYEYARTVAGMYLNKNGNRLIAKKQIALFLEFIRTRLRLPTEIINARFISAVAARSGNTEDATKKLFVFIEKIESQTIITNEDLLKLYREITDYKKKTDGKY